MITAKDQLSHLAASITEQEAERLLQSAERMGLLAPCSCPSCGEAAMDLLSWQGHVLFGQEEDCDFLVCMSCQTTFDPNTVGPLKD